jgi:hypothetical protein
MTNPPELTVTAVGKLITHSNSIEAAKKSFKAFQNFFKEESPAVKKNE